MAKNIIAQTLGGDKKVFDDVTTVAEVQAKLMPLLGDGYQASINGDTASASDVLEDGDVVTFARQVKGG